MKFKLFCSDASESAEFEYFNKGYRPDVFVQIFEKYFKLNFYDLTRLNQDFKDEIEGYGFYSVPPNIVLVEAITKLNIKKTVQGLIEQGYFNEIEPLSKNDEQIISLQQFSFPPD